VISFSPIHTAANPADARRVAAKILSESRFQTPKPKGPRNGPWKWLGDRFSWIGRLFSFGKFHGNYDWVWPIVVGLCLLTGAVLVARTVHSRVVIKRLRARPIEILPPGTQLMGQADAAAKAGDFASSVRLRFQGGLLLLAERSVLDSTSNRPNGLIASLLGEVAQPFRELARVFDALRYGGLSADESHEEQSRQLWRDVLARASAPSSSTSSRSIFPGYPLPKETES
jgi:Domain of unknown function (DUF4129)